MHDAPLFRLARARPVVFDGAMGTEIQRRAPTTADFGDWPGLNEALAWTRPDLIADIHGAYLRAGADVVETDTFGANGVVLAEHGLAGRVRDLNRAAAALARGVADGFATADRPRFVSGSVGPGTKLPSLGQASFRELLATFREQAAGLLAGGVDLVQVETCQDPLQAKAACLGALDAMREADRRVPLFCQLTFEPTGRLLLGTDPAAAAATIASLPGVDVLGMNCATGPESMHAVLRALAAASPLPLAVLPNAGLPENDGGRLVYRLTPEAFAAHLVAFVRDPGVAFVGGCCGTTPEHIAALAAAVAGLGPAARVPGRVVGVSSLYAATSLRQEPRPLIAGERTNVNGSKEFRDDLEAGDLDGMLAVARSQAAEGAHVLDVCLARAGRDEAADVAAFVARLREVVDLPLMIDSTDPAAVEAALEAWPGRAIVNSVNLEDGGAKLDRVAAVARRHGAALVVLTIDATGMAMTADRKLDVAARAVDRLVRVHGFDAGDLLVDPLTFTLASGDPSLRDAAVQTLDALRRIKAALPGVLTSLGVSNVSFGLKPASRRVLNSAFLHHALAAGLDAAILNAGRVLPLAEIPAGLRALADDLLFDRGRPDRDPLEAFVAAFGGPGGLPADGAAAGDAPSPGERLRRRVLRGDRAGLEADLEAALAGRAAMAVIDDVLLPAMREVGERFGRGETQLPFVLRSAEVVKAAVAWLEPRLDRGAGKPRGTIVLATVAGDVHDIGKNLAAILLANQGFRVVDCGTRQPVDAYLAVAARESADAIGLSGLLVQSANVMRDDLAEMRRRGLATPVLVGGAALTRRFVDEVLRPASAGPVFHCADAFDGVKAMDALAAGAAPAGVGRRTSDGGEPLVLDARPTTHDARPAPVRPPDVPFLGTRVEAPAIAALAPLVDRVALFRGQWRFRKGARSDEEWRQDARMRLEPMFQERLGRYEAAGVLAPRAVWGLLPAGSDGTALLVGDGQGRIARFALPRLPSGACLADLVLPATDGLRDVVGAFAVTLGASVAAREHDLYAAGEFAEYLYLHGIAVELAEAAAEWAHARIRTAWGESGDVPGRDRGGASGRFGFGYPACPDLSNQGPLLDLLGASRLGLAVTERHQIVPELSTAAIVLHHPDAAGRFGLPAPPRS